MSISSNLFSQGEGVFRLSPAWVPRVFCRPGKRIKLHPEDYYVLGLERGGIDERWFASTTHAQNGPLTAPDEGLSYCVSADGKQRVLLRDAVDELQGGLIGKALWDKYHRWPVYSKFFDNLGPLPHHIHHDDAHAARVGLSGKPEMYFFPSQVNNYGGEFPFTFFGVNPEITKAQVKQALMNFTKGDNKILELSRAYKLALDTGWDVPAGILHAPGSLCTYEPQFASDVLGMFQSLLYFEHPVSEDLLWANTPEEEMGNFDYLMDVIDWELNVDKDFSKNRFMAPQVLSQNEAYCEEWICYKSPVASAKRLTVYPGQTALIQDAAAYGLIMLQGHGKLNAWDIESPALIRYGALTNDEYFVSEDAAKKGVKIVNTSSCDPIVMLKHFSENPALASW